MIRGNAIIALSNIGDPAAIGVLRKSMQHIKSQIRVYSSWTLGRIESQKAKTFLEKALLKEKNLKVFNSIQRL